MANTTIVVDTVTLEFMNYWPSSTENPPTVIGPNPQVALETSEDPSVLRAVASEDGTISLTEDPPKVQAKLDAAWTSLRTERNARLAATDWVALSDAHLSQDRKDAWFAYRQALRDLPDETQDPTAPEWPLDPTQQLPVPVAGSRLSSLLTHADVEVPVVSEPEPVVEAPVVTDV
jgi:hypothetical protein